MALGNVYQQQLFNSPFSQLRPQRLYGQGSLAGGDAGLANFASSVIDTPISSMGSLSQYTHPIYRGPGLDAANNMFGDSLGKAIGGNGLAEGSLLNRGVSGGLIDAANAEGKGAAAKALKGGLAEAIVPGLAFNVGTNYLTNNLSDSNPYAKSILQGAGAGGQLGSAFGIPGSLVGAAGGAAGQAATSGPGEWLVNQIRNPTNPITQTLDYANPLYWGAKLTGHDQDVDPNQGGVVGLLKDSPLGGFLGLQGDSQSVQTPTPDATVQNTNLDDRFKKLSDSAQLNGQDSQQLKDLYNVMRSTGASDADAWKATTEGAMTAFQNAQSNKQSLGQLTALQNQARSYMQPYVDRSNALGVMQGQALSGLADSTPAAYKDVFKYMADSAPLAAQQASNAYLQQALLVPSQAQQQFQQNQQAQYQNQIQQKILSAQLKNDPNAQNLINQAASGQ